MANAPSLSVLKRHLGSALNNKVNICSALTWPGSWPRGLPEVLSKWNILFYAYRKSHSCRSTGLLYYFYLCDITCISNKTDIGIKTSEFKNQKLDVVSVLVEQLKLDEIKIKWAWLHKKMLILGWNVKIQKQFYITERKEAVSWKY